MAKGITDKGLAVRQRIVEGAAGVIRARGVGHTGLEEIRAATATSSSQLFHYFPGGKAQLLLAVAAHEADQILAEQQPWLDDLSSISAWEAWSDDLFHRYDTQREMCALTALVSQLDPTDAQVRAIVTEMYDRWRLALANGIRALQGRGQARASLDADQTASALLAGVQGGVIMMFATGSSDHLRAALDAHLRVLRDG